MSTSVIQREREVARIAAATEEGAPVAIFELIDRAPSGYIREGTERLPSPVELDAPGWRQILSTSAYRKDGGKGKGYQRVPIRFRASSEHIIPAKQDEEGAPENFENDRIVFKDGRLVVVREGLTTGLYDFLKKDSRNETNPDRIATVQAVYREVFPEKEEEADLGAIFSESKAIEYIETLVLPSEKKGEFSYDEERLEALCRLFNVQGDRNSSKIKGLISTARLDPENFIRKAQEFEERTLVDIVHGEKLGLITFELGRVVYTGKNKVITTYSGKLNVDQKRKVLAGYFMSERGASAYAEYNIELADAKERNIDSNGNPLTSLEANNTPS